MDGRKTIRNKVGKRENNGRTEGHKKKMKEKMDNKGQREKGMTKGKVCMTRIRALGFSFCALRCLRLMQAI